MACAFRRLSHCGRVYARPIQPFRRGEYWKQWAHRFLSVSSTHPQQQPLDTGRSSDTSNPSLKRQLSSGPRNAVDSSLSSPTRTVYKIKEQPLGGNHKKLRVIIIGGGVSGLNMLIQLKKHISGVTPIIYEKNAETGGTWFENRYPGCASDDPSHSYQFSHTPNPKCNSLFSPAAEIQKYLIGVCEKHNLRDEIKCSHSVVRAEWEEESGMWVVDVKDEDKNRTFKDRCHFLMDASGIFNHYKWPDIKGISIFEGDLIHTAHWPADFKYESKAFAVIGNGASGVQIIPELQPGVGKLVHIIRGNSWIAPPSAAVEMCSALTEKGTKKYNNLQINKFSEDPTAYREFMKNIEAFSNQRFRMILSGSPDAEIAQERAESYMRSCLKSNPSLASSLIPSFPIGCRRITPGKGYLKSLLASNVTVISEPVQVSSRGIKLKGGGIINLDAIICATGFDCSFVPRCQLIREHGNLQDIWKTRTPEAYMSCMIEGVPNYFNFLGPNGPLAHGAIPLVAEQLAKYIIRHLQKFQLEHIHSAWPLPAAIDDYSEHIKGFMPRTSWSKPCGSWYKGATKDGPVFALHPGSQSHFFHMLEKPRWEDFEWRTKAGGGGNRFGYLGNGFSIREEEGEDTTWYLNDPHGS